MPRTYRNPVLTGFHPDPSIVRAGGDYYMAHSTFQYFPAVVLTHSRDLVHWRTVGHAVTRTEDLDLSDLEDSHGIWAPDLSFVDGRFVLYATLRLNDPPAGVPAPRRRQLMTTAPSVAGPWSPPVFLDLDDIDPSHFVDTDGRRYLVMAPGATLVPLTPDGTAPAGPPRLLWAGTGRRAPEGPRLLYREGWYLILLAEGGTEWGHCVTAARSRSLEGPYKPCPHNPLLVQADPRAPLQRAGHGQLVETPDGWWMVYLCGRPNQGPFTTLGRETALDPVTWVDGWPVVNGGRGPSIRQRVPALPAFPQGDPGFDGFDAPEPGSAWQFIRNPRPGSWSLTERPGWLRLVARGSDLGDPGAPSALVRREKDHRYTARTRLDFRPLPGTRAGLTCYYDRRNHLTLALGGEGEPTARLTEVRDGLATVLGQVAGIPGPVDLEVEVRGQVRRFRVRFGEGRWRTVGTAADCTFLSDEGVVRGKHHTGTMVGLFVGSAPGVTSSPADFAELDYRGSQVRNVQRVASKIPAQTGRLVP